VKLLGLGGLEKMGGRTKREKRGTPGVSASGLNPGEEGGMQEVGLFWNGSQGEDQNGGI